MSKTILDTIVDAKRLEIAQMPDIADPPVCMQDFSSLFVARPALIAEVKFASPSEGDIVTDSDPVPIAQSYIEGGANAISVLTDREFFKGSFDNLSRIRAITDIPLLCKDFIISVRQIRFARQHGADMCLLIVKILEPETLRQLKQEINRLGMSAVVEVQNNSELDIALELSPEIILINNRNLDHFAVDLDTAETLAARIPEAIKVIAASGIKSPDDLSRFSHRIDGFLIGTALMRANDKTGFLRSCRAAKN